MSIANRWGDRLHRLQPVASVNIPGRLLLLLLLLDFTLRGFGVDQITEAE